MAQILIKPIRIEGFELVYLAEMQPQEMSAWVGFGPGPELLTMEPFEVSVILPNFSDKLRPSIWERSKARLSRIWRTKEERSLRQFPPDRIEDELLKHLGNLVKFDRRLKSPDLIMQALLAREKIDDFDDIDFESLVRITAEVWWKQLIADPNSPFKRRK